MATNLLYPSGYPWDRPDFTECLNEQLDLRIDINMASVILIDGGQGQGKTTLATHILDYYNHRKGFPPVDLSVKMHTQLGLGGADFIGKFNKCRRLGLPAVAYDEAGDYSRASTLSWFNFQLSKLFQKIRSARIIVAIMLPNFNILDNRLFDDEIIRGALHLRDRQKTIKWGNFDVYDIEGLSWIRHWYDKLPKARRKACYSMVTPLFTARFKNLPVERARKLEILSNYGKEREREQAEVKLKGLLDYKSLGDEIGQAIPYTRFLVSKLQIKPVQKIGRAVYFDKGALTRLFSHLGSKQK